MSEIYALHEYLTLTYFSTCESQYENSGRIGTMVIAALNRFNFPFGTILAIAALYVLFQPEVEQLYTK